MGRDGRESVPLPIEHHVPIHNVTFPAAGTQTHGQD